MLDYSVKFGATSVILDIFILDSTKTGTTLAGLAGLVFNTGSLTCYYHRNADATAVQVNLVTMTIGTFTSSGFVEIDAANMPGMYQLCLPNAAFITGATQVSVTLKGAANMAQVNFTIRLTSIDLDDSVRAGLTALPNAAAGANTGLPVVGTQVPNATAGAANGLFIAGSNAATSVNITGNITGNLSGSVGSVTGTVGSVTGAVGSVTGNVGGNLLGTLTTTERNAISDALLDRNMATGVDSGSPTVRTPRQALRASRNKINIAAATFTVYKEDDTTSSWTAAVTSDAAAIPVTGLDPP